MRSRRQCAPERSYDPESYKAVGGRYSGLAGEQSFPSEENEEEKEEHGAGIACGCG